MRYSLIVMAELVPAIHGNKHEDPRDKPGDDERVGDVEEPYFPAAVRAAAVLSRAALNSEPGFHAGHSRELARSRPRS